MAFNTTTPPLLQEVEYSLKFYYASCNAVVVFGLPFAMCGILASVFMIYAISLHKCPQMRCILGLLETIFGLTICTVELLFLRLALFMTPVIDYRLGKFVDVRSLLPYDPMMSLKTKTCRGLVFLRNFINTSRCNIIMAQCCHLGFYGLEKRAVGSYMGNMVGAGIILTTSIINCIPATFLTRVFKMESITMCDLAPWYHYRLRKTSNYHSIFFCDGLLLILVTLFVGIRVESLYRKTRITAQYLNNMTNESDMMKTLISSLGAKFEVQSSRLIFMSFYINLLCPVKLATAIVKLVFIILYSLSGRSEIDYFRLCLQKAGLDNCACLSDALLVMLAPFWWYCKSPRLRDMIRSKIRHLIKKNGKSSETLKKIKPIVVFDEEDRNAVVKYKDWLKRQRMELN